MQNWRGPTSRQEQADWLGDDRTLGGRGWPVAGPKPSLPVLAPGATARSTSATARPVSSTRVFSMRVGGAQSAGLRTNLSRAAMRETAKAEGRHVTCPGLDGEHALILVERNTRRDHACRPPSLPHSPRPDTPPNPQPGPSRDARTMRAYAGPSPDLGLVEPGVWVL